MVHLRGHSWKSLGNPATSWSEWQEARCPKGQWVLPMWQRTAKPQTWQYGPIPLWEQVLKRNFSVWRTVKSRLWFWAKREIHRTYIKAPIQSPGRPLLPKMILRQRSHRGANGHCTKFSCVNLPIKVKRNNNLLGVHSHKRQRKLPDFSSRPHST